MWLLLPTTVVLAPLAFGVPTTGTRPADQREGVGKWAQLPNSPSSWDDTAQVLGLLSSWDGLVRVPSSSMSGCYDPLNPTVVEGLSEALCSPLEVVEGGSRMTMPLTAVLMVSLCNITILHLLPAPGGMLAAVMAVPMARMPAPFYGAGPLRRGGGGGIVELD
jgi:hypothetical protein